MNIISKLKSNIKHVLVATVAMGATSCGLLDMGPLNSITREDMWQTEEDVYKSLISAYDAVQGCTELFYVWGEVGGELISVSSDASGTDYRSVYNHTLTENSQHTSWSSVYGAINKINIVEAFAPQAQAVDATFSVETLNYYLGECKALRAMCYFYMARTYHQLPYITKGSMSDNQDYIVPPISNVQVLDSVKSDLLKALELCRRDWDDLDLDYSMKVRTQKGRISRPVVLAFLADVCLTQSAYVDDPTACLTEAADYAAQAINATSRKGTRLYQFIPDVNDWFTIFYPGNSSEDIFSIQFMRTSTFVDLGWMYSRFKDNIRWQFNETYNNLKQWEGESSIPLTDDKRGLGRSYIQGSGGSFGSNASETVWKYRGMRYDEKGESSNLRQQEISDFINFPIYRVTDMKFIRAEALYRLGEKQAGKDELLSIRKRGVPSTSPMRPNREYFLTLDGDLTVEEFEDELLNEKAAEIAGEGKRWFDLTRIARRQNNPNVIIDRIVETRSNESQRPKWQAKLFRMEAWYFPINRTELNNNKYLTQNPYYSTDFSTDK